MYLLYDTMPNISFIVRQLSKQNANLKVGYLKASKQVIYYLKSTIHLGIIYSANSSFNHRASNCQSSYELISYADSNYTDNPKDQKLMMRHCFFITRVMVS